MPVGATAYVGAVDRWRDTPHCVAASLRVRGLCAVPCVACADAHAPVDAGHAGLGMRLRPAPGRCRFGSCRHRAV